MTASLLEQLKQIHNNQPVWSGDLINKAAKDELIKLGLVMWYEDADLKIDGYAKGVGGYVLTELGKETYLTIK